MAGDWIKMRTDLRTHPKVVRISSALNVDVLRTVGGLWSAWCLFDLHSEDGKLHGYSLEIIDSIIGFPGFAREMERVGWLEVHEDGDSQVLIVPRFEAHNGQSAKRRAQDADRKKLVRKMSDLEADKKRTREEKRRVRTEEDKSSSSRTDAKASWSEKSGFEISDSLISRLEKAYPACDIGRQAARAHEWLLANPVKRKKDHHRFLVNWLARAQERGGDAVSKGGNRGSWKGDVMSSLDLAAQRPVKLQPPPGWRSLLLEAAADPEMVPETWEECYPSVQAEAARLYELKGVAAS